jgi:hypothetical protein
MECTRHGRHERYDSAMTQIVFLPILAAGIANIVVGAVWYHPRVFGGLWMRLINATPNMVERGKKNMSLHVVTAFFAGMVVAYVMNYFGIAWGVTGWFGAVQLACVCWIGFVAPTFLGMVIWEQKPMALYFISAGYWLVAFIVMALVLLF